MRWIMIIGLKIINGETSKKEKNLLVSKIKTFLKMKIKINWRKNWGIPFSMYTLGAKTLGDRSGKWETSANSMQKSYYVS